MEARRRSVDIAIVCPLQKEREAVCAALGFSDESLIPVGTSNYWLGRIGGRNREVPYEIAVAQLAAMGNPEAALTTTRVIADCRPRAVLVVGIAGGVGEVTVGDVVVGTAVFYYEPGKATPDGTKREPYMYPADAMLLRKAATTHTWAADVLRPRADGASAPPKLCFGVIASGEKVIAAQAMRDEIASGHRKIAAIEMEGFGVAAAAWQHELLVRQLAIRGICDSADHNKRDDWQEYAAAAAASFTRHFLLERPL